MTEPTPASPFTSSLEQPEPWQRVLKIAVAREHYDRHYDGLLQEARRSAVRPGFRKGKVPLAVVAKELAHELRAQALENLILAAYKAAVSEHDLVPVGEPEVGKLNLDDGQPLTFEVTIEVRPPLVVRDYEGLPLTRRAARVEDADVEAILQRLRENAAVYERVDREARTGDRVILDAAPLSPAGQVEAERQAKDYEFDLGARGNLEAFDAALGGARAGERRDVTVAYPEDHPNENVRGRTIVYRVDVKEVRAARLPEADDAFAATLKPGQTLLELRLAIRRDLERQEQEAIRRELEEQALDRLLERNEVPVPPSLVEKYLEAGLADLHEQNARRGHPDSAEEDARYRELTRPLAERVLKTMFLLEALREQEKLGVGPADVDERIAAIAAEYGFDPEKYREYANQGPERERIGRALEEKRAFDFLIERAQVTAAPGA